MGTYRPLQRDTRHDLAGPFAKRRSGLEYGASDTSHPQGAAVVALAVRSIVIVLTVLSVAAAHAQSPATAPAQPAPAAQSDQSIQAKHDQAVALDAAGRPKEAIPLFQAVIAQIEAQGGPNAPALAPVLANQATAYANAGEYDQADAALKRALSVAEHQPGDTALERGRLLANLASLDSRRGAFQSADRLFAQADDALHAAQGVDRAIYLTERASHDLRMGRAAAAEKEETESLRLKQAAKADPQLIAESDNNLGVIYLQMGRFAEAEQKLRAALVQWEQVLGPDHPKVADALTNLSDVYTQTSRFDDALQVSERALRIRQKAYGADHPKTAAALNNLSSIYLASGDPTRAAEYAQQAMKAMVGAQGSAHPDVAVALDNVAELLLTQKRGAEAVKLFERALRIRVAAYGKDHPAVATSLLNVGRFLFDNFQKEQGVAPAQRAQEVKALEQLFSQADAIIVQSLGKDHPWRIETLSRLALLWREQGRYREALDAARTGAHLAQAAYRQMGSMGAEERRRGLGRYRSAFEAYLVVMTDPAVARLGGVSSDETFEIGQWAQVSTASVALQQAAARVGSQRGDALGGLVRTHQAALDRARTLDKRLIEAVSLPPAQRNAEAEHEAYLSWQQALADVRSADSKQKTAFPQYYEAFHFTPVPTARLQQVLRPGETLVSFVVAPTESFVWSIDRDHATLAEIPAGAPQIAKAVKRLRDGVDVSLTGSLAATGFDAAEAYKLYQLLFKPIAASLGQAGQLILVPDGDLFRLPFGMLATDPPPAIGAIGDYRKVHWLIAKTALTTVPSPGALAAVRTLAKHSQAREALLGIGNPDFHVPAASGVRASDSAWARDANFVRTKIPALQSSGSELREMATLLGQGDSMILAGRQASERAVKTLPLRDYRIVAFSTHALMTGEIPFIAEPALILSPPARPSSEDDGVLTASEIAGLRMDADLVILSACNTAAPGAQSSEGLSGLARAFFFAGSRALLVSNW
jgi:CHAT domain-containing protein